jgi:uncharacterized protein YqfB (UPF0267 family)
MGKRGRPKGSKNKKKKPTTKIKINKKMDRKDGVYTSDSESSYKSKEQIQTEKMYKGKVSVEYPDRYIAELSFEELHEEMERRAELRQKVENKEYNATIEIKTDKPIAIGWFADVHSGGADIDYERLKWEVDEIKANPYMKVLLGGDLADSFCWNPAQYGDIANLNEQNLYLHKMLEYMGYDSILGGVIGNHEVWSRRTGMDMYNDLRKNIPLFDGVGTVELVINDVVYTGAIMHKSKGHSYFNPNHGQKRFSMENEGYDFVCSAHTHVGSEQSQIKSTANGSRKIVFLSGKTFKRGDDFLGQQGNPRLDGDGIGTNWILFNHKKKMMIPLSSTAEVISVMGGI